MSSNIIEDTRARQEAIDPSRSFIVQAPAGSGKTELLVQRYLKLLTTVKANPEEILAITFTKKAASEMRHRVLSALTCTKTNLKAMSNHKRRTWELAKEVMGRGESKNWQIQENPTRLRIMTIDALSLHLTKLNPLSAKIKTPINLTENPKNYYQEAARQLILHTRNNQSIQKSIETLLLHLDNRADSLSHLFSQILSRREQWLPHIITNDGKSKILKRSLDRALKNIILNALKEAYSNLNEEILSELLPLAHFASIYFHEHEPDNPIYHLHNINSLSISLDDLPLWKGLCQLLLTKKGEWRKIITKEEGFPTKGASKEATEILNTMKQRMKNCLKKLAKYHNLRLSLYEITLCPPIAYNEQQWAVIDSLMQVLPLLYSELKLIFQCKNEIDFIELNFAALRTLADLDNPTELAAHLDYEIKHLLVDEFQDTSLTQFELIERLISGWKAGDGRSIFVVGDPMQSIYRFRNAEVALFIKAQEKGIAQIPLTVLKLSRNFRSSPEIINWNNALFGSIFPKKSNIILGAMPFYPSETSIQTPLGDVQWHSQYNDDGIQEASTLVEIVQSLQSNFPSDNKAILIRSRTHLPHIIDALKDAKIPFDAVDLDLLRLQDEIQDIHILSRALLHRLDKIAWLSILRAPYCGIKLEDLTIIAQHAERKSVYQVLQKLPETLSNDAKKRLKHCACAIYDAVENIHRKSFGTLIKKLWESLGGMKTLVDTHQLNNIQQYLSLLEDLEYKNKAVYLVDLENRLLQLYDFQNSSDPTVLQIMTIHKAKGLEFDHVILPGLHHKIPYDSCEIFTCLKHSTQSNTNDLILAPIKGRDACKDEIYSYLRHFGKKKASYEAARLLYVASTRAKKSLHFMANVNEKKNRIMMPKKDSFLFLLWERAKRFYQQKDLKKRTCHEVQNKKLLLKRLHSNYYDDNYFSSTHQSISKSAPFKWDLPKRKVKIIGTIIHEILQYAFTQNCDTKTRLQELGLPLSEIHEVEKKIEKITRKLLKDPKVKWILSSQHEDRHSEWSLSTFENYGVNKLVIDCSFVDDTGTRWIIDYKVSKCIEKKAYQRQLEKYANALRSYEDKPIMLGLYFPLTLDWIEWSFEKDQWIT